MTTEFFNINVKIVKLNCVNFRINKFVKVSFNSGFAFYVPGYGYAKFVNDPLPYVLSRKKDLQAILNEGGFLSMDSIEFVQGEQI